MRGWYTLSTTITKRNRFITSYAYNDHMQQVVVPISGGMDSTVLLHWACTTYTAVHAISFDYTQRHHRELAYAVEQVEICRTKYSIPITHRTIDVGFIRSIAPTSSLTNDDISTPDVRVIRGEAQPKSYVPNRNMMFLSIATAYAEAQGANAVLHGAAQADSLAGYFDGDETFVVAMNAVNALNREHRVMIEAPLINMSKADIVRKGVEFGVDFAKTYTCYAGGELADANSASSSLRIAGFIEAGYIDPIKYIQQDRLDQVYAQRGCRPIN
jgi:7-cyano-7-deazaguanine synthase